MYPISRCVPSCSRNWSEIPGDILVQIFIRLDSLHDQTCFSRVCCSWQDVANSVSLPPCVLLPQKAESTIRSILPYPYSKKINFDHSEMHDKLLYHTSRGSWFLMLGLDPEVTLFNPITCNKICLPPLTGINIVHFDASRTGNEYSLSWPYRGADLAHGRTLSLQSMRSSFIMKVVMSSSSKDPRSEIVMIIVRRCGTHAYYCKPGDEHWSILPLCLAEIWDLTYSTNHFYLMDYGGRIKVVSCSELRGTSDLSEPSWSQLQLPRDEERDRRPRPNGCYLVGSERGLFLVRKEMIEKSSSGYDVFSLETIQQHEYVWRKVNSVNDLAFFLCRREGLSFSSVGDVHQFKGNLIYSPDFYRLDDDSVSEGLPTVNPENWHPYYDGDKEEKNFSLRCEIEVTDMCGNVSGRCPTEWIVEWKDRPFGSRWFSPSFD